jgi:two-component system, OmpR family, phosphate regulon sensor histidine kinase PhoR
LTNDSSINYQQFFTKLIEAAPWPVVIIDCKLSIYFYNQRCVRLLEAAEPLQGLSLEHIIHERTVLQFVRESIQTGQAHNGEFTLDPSGTAWRVSITPLEDEKSKERADGAKEAEMAKDPEAAIHGYFAITIEDLAELRRLERVRRDFIANISHELRTPLASVRLLAETLEEAIDTDRENAQMFLEKIETEVHHLDALVSELLELSRIESGLIPMVIEPVEAERLVREVMARMLPQAQRHRVMLRTDIGEGNMLVAADSKQVARVLVNLVHNAIKFTPSGGTVTIGTAIQAGGQAQQFFVRDTGVGIRPEELPRIFERFYKADHARSKTDFMGPGGGGSGLGLAIARHVVEAQGGRITAESRVGHGSTFTFTLPVAVRNSRSL